MAQIFFKRDGKLHEANIGSLLSEYWTEASSVQFLGWYTADRYLKITPLYPRILVNASSRYVCSGMQRK